MMALYESIILKDIVKRHKIKQISLLKNLFKFLADNIGNLFSINKISAYLIANKIKTNTETMSSYIDYLKEAFLIHEVERYDIKGKTILSSTKKYYLNDVGFKNYFMSSYDISISKQLENSIYLQLLQNGYYITVGIIGDKEIDFIAEKNNKKIYIQVTVSLQSEAVINREYDNLESVYDAHEKWVISLDDTISGNRNGIQHVYPWEL
jgi:predicted AAA+ superfamily ATPase